MKEPWRIGTVVRVGAAASATRVWDVRGVEGSYEYSCTDPLYLGTRCWYPAAELTLCRTDPRRNWPVLPLDGSEGGVDFIK